MADTPFVHLHCHTDYSLLDGACEISQLMDTVAEQKMPAVAMTDHGNLFGAVQFYNTAKAKGIHPVIGCEVYVSQQGHKTRVESDRYNHLVLLCENQEGYRNLIDLVSTAYLEGFYYKPRIDKDLLATRSKGLIALSACLRGDINETIMAERYDEARRLAYTYQDIFGRGNFFLEIQDHGLEQDKRVTPQVNRLSSETGIPLVATNDAHYLHREDARAHEILMCIQTGKTMSDPARMHWEHPDFYLKSRAEMMQLFGELEEAVDRSWEIAQGCQVKLEKIKEPFPRFDVPTENSTDTYFEFVARPGFEKRRPRLEALRAQGLLKHDLAEYTERLDREIRMIQQMKFSGYFLIVWDFIRFAKTQTIPVGPGRGSAAGSLVSYAMQITDIDPLEYGLLFERFLNPERISMPDIDIDFCMNRRGEVIQYVTEKYGREQVAQIITFNTLGARAAIKDVGRVLDMSFADVDRITKLVPNVLNISLDNAIKTEPGFEELARKDQRVDDILKVARRLEGMARNCSVHAAGVVISPEPLKNLVPLYKTNRDEIVTQYDMNGLEKLSLLKMDFLGLTTLTLIDDAVKLIEKRHGVKLVLEDLPLDDPQSYEIFSRGFTSGVFQFESPGMRDILRRYQPTRIEDLTARNALYRPGPIQGGMLDDFIERKHGRKAIAYDLPELRQILEETYGVILYQEQVMQIASRLAGYSLGEADILRRAMGKKKAEEMASQRERFLAGCRANKIPDKKGENIFDLMEEFAGYGFNKSHSCAYALLAYQTAYLKSHYPVEFMAALLTSETGSTERVVKYINEARGMGITVLPPDVHESGLYFTPVGESIRFGLAAVKNVGENTARAICEAHALSGDFQTFFKFCEVLDTRVLNRRVLESLIKSGALDALGGRSQLIAVVDRALERAQKVTRARGSGQHAMFAGSYEPVDYEALPDAGEWSEEERLAGEYAVLGFYVSGHPLEKYADRLKDLKAVDLGAVEGRRSGEEITVAGIIVSIRPMRSRKGARWAIFTLQDLTGVQELLAFPEACARMEGILKVGTALLIKGRVNIEEAGTRVVVVEAHPLEQMAERAPALMRVRVDLAVVNELTLDRLQELFESKPGNCPVAFELLSADGSKATLQAQQCVRADQALVDAISAVCGADAVEVVR